MNFRYNVHKCEVQCNAFTAVQFSFSSVFLLASSSWMLFVCVSSVCALCSRLVFLKHSLLMLLMVEFGALVGLLEVELPPGSSVSWNCSTECCQFY